MKLDVTEKYSVKEEGESSNPSSVPPQIKQELEPESHQLLPPAAAAQEEAGPAAPKQSREFFLSISVRSPNVLKSQIHLVRQSFLKEPKNRF